MVFFDNPEYLLADALLAVRLTDVVGPFWLLEEKLFELVTGLGIFDFFNCPGGLIFDWLSFCWDSTAVSLALMLDNIDATVLGAGFELLTEDCGCILDSEGFGSFVELNLKKKVNWFYYVVLSSNFVLYEFK